MSDLTFEQKTAINIRFQSLYDEGRRIGTHGHYETMFGAMHKAYAEFRDGRLSYLPSPILEQEKGKP